jgi:hypothetical protein
MSTVLVGAAAAIGFVAMARIIQPLVSGGAADFTTPPSLAEVGYALGMGLLVVALIEGLLWAGV